MGENSKIEWCHHTFNPWIGCAKVSAGCAHCYAEREFGRKPAWADCWGVGGERKRTSDAYWRQPLKWDREAAAAGERRRVFCGSLCDVFEDREDLLEMQLLVLCLTTKTPHLDWLFLTKRPDSAKKIMDEFYFSVAQAAKEVSGGKIDHVPDDWLKRNAAKTLVRKFPNIWLGVSVENQAAADGRIPELLKIPAAKRFVSVEPMLGPVDLLHSAFNGSESFQGMGGIDWVICGGESGPGARPMHPDWARSLRDQCVAAGVPFFMKQMSGKTKSERHAIPDDLMIREYPNA